jgi:prefoldin subunit 5
MLESFRGVETNLWLFAGKVLNLAQQAELRAAIQNWRLQNPQPESVLAAGAVGFASQLAGAINTDPAKPESVFNLLMLDPLSGMDPAVREIAHTRMFAERALYVTQKMPRLVRWQTELLSLNAVRLPAVQQLVANSTQLTSSVESFAQVAGQLPKLVTDQREAAIQQAFDGLARERTNLVAILAADELKLRPTLVELRQTVDASTELVKASEATVKSLDTLMARFDKGTNALAATPTNARPFDILDYALTAREFTATIKELNATISSLDKAVPQIQKATESLERTGNRMLNRLFLLGAGLVALFSIGLSVAVRLHGRHGRKVEPA